mgnify:CR=1 FL=1
MLKYNLLNEGGLCMKISNLKVVCLSVALASSIIAGVVIQKNNEFKVTPPTKNEQLQNYDDIIDTINLTGEYIKSEEEFNYVLDRIKYNRKKNDKEYYISNVTIQDIELENYSIETKQKLNQFLIDLGRISELNAISLSLEDISFLENTDIGELNLNDNKITNIETLSTIKNLAYLDLSNNKISDLSPLSNLNLFTLYLGSNNITDITPLSNLMRLVKLDLSYNNISNLSPLKEPMIITNLKLIHNNITDLTPLSNLGYLITLDVSENNITNLNGLENMFSLDYITLGGNNIENIDAIIPLIKRKNINVVFSSLSEDNISLIEDTINNKDNVFIKIKNIYH